MARRAHGFIGGAAALALALATVSAEAVTVDQELGLVIDISGSIDDAEFSLQLDGYAKAFEDPFVQDAIVSKPNGVATSVFLFNNTATKNDDGSVTWTAPYLLDSRVDSNSAIGTDGWVLLTNRADADNFASILRGLPRPQTGGGDTNIASGIDAARQSINNNQYTDGTKAIDVSSDGIQNTLLDGTRNSVCNTDTLQGPLGCIPTLQDARDDAAADGMTINGLAITTEPLIGDQLPGYMEDNMITGDEAFVLATTLDEAVFDAAIREKIRAEVGAIPIPAALPLMLSAIAALGLMARRRRALS